MRAKNGKKSGIFLVEWRKNRNFASFYYGQKGDVHFCQ